MVKCGKRSIAYADKNINDSTIEMTQDQGSPEDEFDVAGRELLARLGLDSNVKAPNDLDNFNTVYRHKSGGSIIVGDQRVAKYVPICKS